MSIASNSRYVSNTVTAMDVDGSSRQVIMMSPPAVTTFTYVLHTYTADETIENLAYLYLGDPTQWWQIGDANPEIIDWTGLAPGTVIRIPTGSMTSTP